MTKTLIVPLQGFLGDFKLFSKSPEITPEITLNPSNISLLKEYKKEGWDIFAVEFCPHTKETMLSTNEIKHLTRLLLDTFPFLSSVEIPFLNQFRHEGLQRMPFDIERLANFIEYWKNSLSLNGNEPDYLFTVSIISYASQTVSLNGSNWTNNFVLLSKSHRQTQFCYLHSIFSIPIESFLAWHSGSLSQQEKDSFSPTEKLFFKDRLPPYKVLPF